MFYGRKCFSGVHVFQDDMSYERICPNGGNNLLGKCLMGGHILVYKSFY